MSFILGDMSGTDVEKRVPLHTVLMSVGLICIITAGAIFLVMPRSGGQPVGQSAAVPIPPEGGTGQSAATATAGVPVLMPETLPDEGTTGSFAIAAESAAAHQGQPYRIRIPAIDLQSDITPVGLQAIQIDAQTYFQWQVPPSFSVGWHNTTAYLGERGNTVLNGHHNIYGDVFGELVDLAPGDAIFLTDNLDQEYHYVVSQVEILPERGEPLNVRLENASWIEQTEDERITLVTCWPHDDNSHRLIVVAFPETNLPTGHSPEGTADG